MTVLKQAFVGVAVAAVGLGVAASGAWAGTPSFASPVAYPVGAPEPFTAAIADFDGDGYRDVVTARRSDTGPVALFVGDGSGKLTPKSDVATVGYHPLVVKSADLNGDGYADLVAGTLGDAAVALGDGKGGFGARSVLAPVSGTVHDVEIADLNRDGNLDIVTSGVKVHTYLGDGKGAFTLKDSDLEFVNALTVVDVSNDGNLDAVVSSDDAQPVTVLLGDGTGALGAPKSYDVGTASSSSTVGDFTGDGKPDIVAQGNTTETISLFPGDGSGGFGARQDIPTASTLNHVQTADVDNDNRADIVAEVGELSRRVGVLRGNGQGLESLVTFESDVGSRIPALGDLNGDGKLDVVTPNRFSQSVSVLLNTTPVTTTGSGPSGPTSNTTGSSGSQSPSGGPAAGKPKDAIAPTLTQPKLSATVFAVNTKARASATRRKPPLGTKLGFKLSETAKITVATQHKVKGRWRTLSTFTRSLKAGKRTITYSGRIKVRGKAKTLKPGRYRLQVQPTDAAGNKGKLTTIGFTIVKRT